jgi:enoyl-CoA hydratase/carnithine racemase
MASAADHHANKQALKMQPSLTIRFEQRGAVAWITLNRPDAMNALSETMCTELRDATERCERDPAIRVIVLTGAGRAFCAGADLKGVFESSAGDPGPSDAMGEFLDLVGGMMDSLRVCPKPTIAALNGLTMAGGLELAMACDLIIAAESARIGDAHANFGVFPGAGGAAILPRRIGATAAKYLLFTGDTMDGPRVRSDSAPGRTAKLHGRRPVGRRAADAGDRARDHGRAETHADRRAVTRAGAAHGRGSLQRAAPPA